MYPITPLLSFGHQMDLFLGFTEQQQQQPKVHAVQASYNTKSVETQTGVKGLILLFLMEGNMQRASFTFQFQSTSSMPLTLILHPMVVLWISFYSITHQEPTLLGCGSALSIRQQQVKKTVHPPQLLASHL